MVWSKLCNSISVFTVVLFSLISQKYSSEKNARGVKILIWSKIQYNVKLPLYIDMCNEIFVG